MIIRRICYLCEKHNIVQNNSNIAVPDSGMNRDKHPQDLSQSEYSFALNATIEGDDGSQLKIQNEPSTLLCKRFDGYKVIGYKNDIAGDNTYFFLSIRMIIRLRSRSCGHWIISRPWRIS